MILDKFRISFLFVTLFILFCLPAYAINPQTQTLSTTQLQLSQEELVWLEDHPIIRVASDPGWRPLEYQDNDGQFKGIAIDYLKLIEKRLGVKFEIEINTTWAELVKKSKAREIDMFSCIAVTPDRKTYLTFTDPYLSFPASIFTRNDAPYVGEIKELAKEKVAVVDGYAFHELIAENYPEIDLVPVGSVPQGLEMLKKGDVSAFVGNLLVGSYYIASEGAIFLKVAGEAPYRNELGMAVRNDWPELNGILQKALASISPEEKRKIYSNWVSLTYEHKFDRKLLFQVLAFFIALFAMTLIIVQQRQLKARKRTMLESSRRKAEFEAVFQSMTDSLILTNDQRRIVMVNKAFVDLFGYCPEEVIGKTTEFIYASKNTYVEQGRARYSADAKTGQPIYEMSYRRKDGSVFSGETMGVKVNDSNETLIGFLGTIRDITERKQIEEQLLLNDRLKSEFIATASHELRTPLTVILGYIDLLQENSLTPELKKDALGCIYEKAHILDRLVNDLLDVSRIESGRTIQLLRSPARISEIIERVCKQFKQINHDYNIALQFPDNVPLLDIDRDRMVQVFENLIGNAIKFSPKGGDILVKGNIVDNTFLITVEDEGVGVDDEHLENVFGKFYRADGSDTAIPGLGIGLYLVKNIIVAHNGEIWIESRKGSGTKVLLSLPLD